MQDENNLNNDLSQFLRKLSVVENTQDKILYIEDKYVHFTRIRPSDLVYNDDENSIFSNIFGNLKKIYKHY